MRRGNLSVTSVSSRPIRKPLPPGWLVGKQSPLPDATTVVSELHTHLMLPCRDRCLTAHVSAVHSKQVVAKGRPALIERAALRLRMKLVEA